MKTKEIKLTGLMERTIGPLVQSPDPPFRVGERVRSALNWYGTITKAPGGFMNLMSVRLEPCLRYPGMDLDATSEFPGNWQRCGPEDEKKTNT